MINIFAFLDDLLEPSRSVDVMIWCALPSDGGDRSDIWYTPKFTASLDAAASLIPEGFDWILERTNDGLTIGARVGHNDPDRTSWGATPAIALCIAALRARADSALTSVEQ